MTIRSVSQHGPSQRVVVEHGTLPLLIGSLDGPYKTINNLVLRARRMTQSVSNNRASMDDALQSCTWHIGHSLDTHAYTHLVAAITDAFVCTLVRWRQQIRYTKPV